MKLAELILAIIRATVQSLQVLQVTAKAIRDAQERGDDDISEEDKKRIEQLYQESRKNVENAIQEAIHREAAEAAAKAAAEAEAEEEASEPTE